MVSPRLIIIKRKCELLYRKHTRESRFLAHLILIKLRLWLVPIWQLEPAEYLKVPQDPWPGDTDKGQALLDETFCADMGGDAYVVFWECSKKLAYPIQRNLHEFQWLRHLSANKNRDLAAQKARDLIDEWHETLANNKMARRYNTRAERFTSQLQYQKLLADGASESWLQQQNKYLHQEFIILADYYRRNGTHVGMSVMKGLFCASLVMPRAAFILRRLNRDLKPAIKKRLYPDGGHRSRSPEWHRWDVGVLIEIRSMLKEYHIVVDSELDELIQNALDAMATFMHGDNKLACFHDSIEQRVDMFINLWQVWRKPKPLAQKTLPNTGFVHLKRKDSTLIFDVGYRPQRSIHHHASPLAFEFSRPNARAIVNCGAYRGDNPAWKGLSGHTAAHSTLALDHYDAWGKGIDDIKFKIGKCLVEETESHLNVVANHFGYADKLGFIHERRVTVSDDGLEISGCDSLMPTPKSALFPDDKAQNVYIRFHLHPSAKVEKITPQALTVKLKNGELWEFTVEDNAYLPLVEESVYLGENGAPQPTYQFVIASHMPEEFKTHRFAWKFTLIKS